jgi:IMP cyclohydrolase
MSTGLDYVNVATRNLRSLHQNPYPGRGLILGLDETDENLIQVCWIMDRSENSRNRIFDSEFGRLFTVPRDPSKVQDPSLIIYDAMVENDGHYVVSNGHQTNSVLAGISNGFGFKHGLIDWQYEPNFTPRITGVISTRNEPLAQISILRKSQWSGRCDRFFFRYESLGTSYGYCITTYLGDGDPLPAFQGEPLLVPLPGDIEQVAQLYWQTLNPLNLVSLAVKFISKETGRSEIKIINKYERIAAAV